MGDNVKTYIRIKSNTQSTEFVIKGNVLTFQDKHMKFDRVFVDSSQKDLFDSISEDILICAMQGYNCTIFAYGQTGSGKTFTIQGNENNLGLVPRCLCYLHNLNMDLVMSFVEIYNENMIDLFDDTKILNLRDDPLKNVTVDNLTLIQSKDYDSSLAYYEKGIKTRRTKSTDMNIESSRSHSIFTVYINNKSNDIMKSSKLVFVDLAGSERLKNLDIEEIKIKETANINRSLFCLGQIIYKLSENNTKHIGYRDSKLTFLLKDSLGGNSKLRVIGNVCLENKNDTLNTLNFLCRLKLINNIAVVNSDILDCTVDLKARLQFLDQENQKLKTQIALHESFPRKYKEEDIEIVQFYVKKVKEQMKLVMEQFEEFENLKTEYAILEYELKKDLIVKSGQIYKELVDKRKEEFDKLFNADLKSNKGFE